MFVYRRQVRRLVMLRVALLAKHGIENQEAESTHENAFLAFMFPLANFLGISV